MKYRIIYILVILSCMTLVAIPNVIGLVEEKNLNDLVKESDNIVIGKVTNKISYWEDKVIFTDIDISIKQNIKGKQDKIKLKIPGGTVGNVTLTVEDVPSFARGEETLLFLKENQIVGQFQGKYSIKDDNTLETDESLGIFVNKIKNIMSGKYEKEKEVPINETILSTPYISSISPSFGPVRIPASTSTRITIVGTNFGTSKGRVRFWRVGSSYNNATIESWSDTKIVARVPLSSSYNQPNGNGNVQVIKSSGESSNFGRFLVTYSYEGIKWPTKSMTFRVNPNTPDTTGELNAVRYAANTWTWVGSNFKFIYGGTTSLNRAYLGDGINSITWVTVPNNPYTAVAYTWSQGGDIIECDINVNDNLNWYTDGSSMYQDVQTILTHELGHCLRLDDQYGTSDREEVMLGHGHSDAVFRKLSQHDVDGIRYIYGPRPAPSGTQEIFAIGTSSLYSGGLWHRWQYSPNGGFVNGWEWLKGGSIRDPVIGKNADGRLQAFVIGGIDKVYTKWQTKLGGPWSDWLKLGGSMDKIIVEREDDGRLVIFAIGKDKSVYMKGQFGPNSYSGWSNWISMGGNGIKNITVGKNADGTLELFVIGGDNAVYHKWELEPNGFWSNGWSKMSGWTWADRLTIGTHADGRLQLFVRGGDKAVYTRWQTVPGGLWNDWTRWGLTIEDMAVGRNADGRQMLFTIGTNNAVYYKWQTASNGGWIDGWGTMGGWVDRLVVGTNADGRVEVFVRGGNKVLYRKWQVAPNDGWSDWSYIDGIKDVNYIAVGKN